MTEVLEDPLHGLATFMMGQAHLNLASENFRSVPVIPLSSSLAVVYHSVMASFVVAA